MLDHFIVSVSLANRIDIVEVVEENGSKLHKLVRCEMPMNLPSASAGHVDYRKKDARKERGTRKT